MQEKILKDLEDAYSQSRNVPGTSFPTSVDAVRKQLAVGEETDDLLVPNPNHKQRDDQDELEHESESEQETDNDE